MATYPGGVFSPAAKSNGQTIQAAHVSDLDSEVAAIENALLNGLAHSLTVSTGGITVSTGGLRVGGASTIAGTLQVTGDSTFTGAVSVSGASTFGGAVVMSSGLTVTGGITVDGTVIGSRIPSVVLRAASSQTAAQGTWTGLNWTIEDVDSTGMHSTAVNSSRANLLSSGLFAFGGLAVWKVFGTNPSTSAIAVRVLANDTQGVAYAPQFVGAGADGTLWASPIAGMYYAPSTGEWLTLQAWQSVQASGVVEGSTGLGSGPTQFWVRKVSA